MRGARVVVGVAGGIAAYKAAELVRLLDKAGAEVRVVMTARAQRFVGALTFQGLTGRPVFTDMFNLSEDASIGHIKAADEADLVIIAPASANIIARMAAGMADDPVTAIVLATKAPVLLAPSMNVNMWNHPITVDNVRRLRDVAGYHVVAPGVGYLACRWVGAGRLAEPADIVEAAAKLRTVQDLTGQRVLVTAGPTHEALDPARYLANRSSGKMGIAVAHAAHRRGATVTLVLGPTAQPVPPGITVHAVETALQMQTAVRQHAHASDVVVMSAAVADFRAANLSTQKLKRSSLGLTPTLALQANPDILAALGADRSKRKAHRPLLVGFAAETHDVLANARDKLARKQIDVIVANDVAQADAGFGVDTNRVIVIDAHHVDHVPFGSKAEVAHHIWDALVPRLTISRMGATAAKAATAGSPRPTTTKSGKPAATKRKRKPIR
ncbi:MAG: bifunctional phosphopantothenoylcysteine decarboxylase/phosphopantothenate--cysteine ligase CoaBC [Kofleriaceae bacterium]|nr:bifunctional phosphopantothenoylcysteine decarboxylase/phosphopantothenate--cysteine ligase CoaBC [Kofleriaceae bacterium]